MQCNNESCSNTVRPTSESDRRSVYCSTKCRHSARNPEGRATVKIALRMDDYHAAAALARIDGATVNEWVWGAVLQAIDGEVASWTA